MYLNKITQENIKKLKKNNFLFIDVESGELASGLIGKGRLSEPETIVTKLETFLANMLPLSGVNCLVTAGPTFEKIDPVRFIGNFSSGKMGCSIANELIMQGANVELILGPSSESVNENINLNRVVSSQEMLDISLKKYEKQDIIIFLLPFLIISQQLFIIKNKEKSDDLNLALNKTEDILKTLGQRKKSQFYLGLH